MRYWKPRRWEQDPASDAPPGTSGSGKSSPVSCLPGVTVPWASTVSSTPWSSQGLGPIQPPLSAPRAAPRAQAPSQASLDVPEQGWPRPPKAPPASWLGFPSPPGAPPAPLAWR